jgi:allantoicase
MSPNEEPEFTRRWANMASARLGAQAIAASDEFFAPKDRMLDDAPPVFIADKFDANGKWMDGWETRRRRTPGHDYCVVKLAARCLLHGIYIDTMHFTGNYPEAASVDVCVSPKTPGPDTVWRNVIPQTSLMGNNHHFIPLDGVGPADFLRLNIYPDGGVARLRVYGEASFDWGAVPSETVVELSAFAHGGKIVAYNDAHYGPPWPILTPGRGVNMGDGWETRRRRTPGHDWIIVALGTAGHIECVEVDTAHFKGNYPDACSLQATSIAAGSDPGWANDADGWPVLLEKSKLQADHIHRFSGADLNSVGAANVVRLNIFPDGGVSRLRLIGRKA